MVSAARTLPSPIPHRSGYKPNPPEVIWTRYAVNPASGCWEWSGALDRHGYGQVSVYGSNSLRAHVIAALLTYGDIPAGYVVNHKCAVRRCIRPDHIEVVTFLENQREMLSRRRLALTCKHGHNEWRVRPNGTRSCKACDRIAHQRKALRDGQ